MSPKARRDLIKSIIETEEITCSQGAFAEIVRERARERGFEVSVTQTQVSRDFRELGIKWDEENRQWTVQPDEAEQQRQLARQMVAELVTDMCVEVSPFALKTEPGFARATAVHIESTFAGKVFGTLSSEDVVLVLATTMENRKDVVDALNRWRNT